MICPFCNEAIDPEKPDPEKGPPIREVKGWEKSGRGAGGQSGSSLLLRRATGAVAHEGCVVKAKHLAKHKLNAKQDSLL